MDRIYNLVSLCCFFCTHSASAGVKYKYFPCVDVWVRRVRCFTGVPSSARRVLQTSWRVDTPLIRCFHTVDLNERTFVYYRQNKNRFYNCMNEKLLYSDYFHRGSDTSYYFHTQESILYSVQFQTSCDQVFSVNTACELSDHPYHRSYL